MSLREANVARSGAAAGDGQGVEWPFAARGTPVGLRDDDGSSRSVPRGVASAGDGREDR
jgi:hypothetical protein